MRFKCEHTTRKARVCGLSLENGRPLRRRCHQEEAGVVAVAVVVAVVAVAVVAVRHHRVLIRLRPSTIVRIPPAPWRRTRDPNQNIQHPVSATDDDGDRLTYRLSGDDADSFTIISSSGQLRTRSGVTYDHEAVKNSYEVTITADDNRGGDATIDVTVYVGDVNEPSRAPARPQVEPASSTSLTVTWTEPTNTGPDIYDYDIQYRKGSDSFMPWPQNNTGTTSTITDLDVNTRYEVQVKGAQRRRRKPLVLLGLRHDQCQSAAGI